MKLQLNLSLAQKVSSYFLQDTVDYYVCQNVPASLTWWGNKKAVKQNTRKAFCIQTPNADLVLWPPSGLILPGCLPLLVIERRLVNYLLQWVKVLIFPDQQNASHSYKQQGFAEEVAHLVDKPHARQAINKVSHEEANHGSTTCIDIGHIIGWENWARGRVWTLVLVVNGTMAGVENITI